MNAILVIECNRVEQEKEDA
jgi:chromosome segregation ATPase